MSGRGIAWCFYIASGLLQANLIQTLILEEVE